MKPVDIEELESILQELREAKNSGLGPQDHAKLQGMVEAYRYLGELASEEGTTIERIRERFSERFKLPGERESRRGDDTAPSV
jgi:hypothetical protein